MDGSGLWPQFCWCCCWLKCCCWPQCCCCCQHCLLILPKNHCEHKCNNHSLPIMGWGRYTGFTMSVCPFVHLSVEKVFSALSLLLLPFDIQWWYFIHVLTMTQRGPLLIFRFHTGGVQPVLFGCHYYYLGCLCIDFNDLSAWWGSWFVVYKKGLFTKENGQ